MHTLIIADNQYQATFVQHGLGYENLASETISFSDGQGIEKALVQVDGLFILVSNIFALDKMIEYCRHYQYRMPIIVLSQEFNLVLRELEQAKKIQHFFTRPFPFRRMASEMRLCVFEQKEKIENNLVSLRNLMLNRETHELNYGEKSIYLRNKEYALLEFLMMNQNRVLSRGYILENVWDRNANMLTNTVDVHINRLRKKIDYYFQEEFIHTISCNGYIFA